MKSTKKLLSLVRHGGNYAVGGVLLISSITKALALKEATEQFAEFGIPQRFAGPLVKFVVSCEGVLGLGIVASSKLRTLCSSLASAMLAAFSVSILASKILGNSGRCPCFGQSIQSLSPIGSLVRNLVLIFFSTNLGDGRRPIPKLLPLAISGLLVVIEMISQLRRRDAGFTPPLADCDAVGKFFPKHDFYAAKIDAESDSGFSEFSVVVLSEHCQPCMELTSLVAQLDSPPMIPLVFVAQNEDHAVHLETISSNVTCRSIVIEPSLLFDLDICVMGTPSAFTVSKTGQLSSTPVHGVQEVLNLIIPEKP